jgi:hypothetical protein
MGVFEGAPMEEDEVLSKEDVDDEVLLFIETGAKAEVEVGWSEVDSSVMVVRANLSAGTRIGDASITCFSSSLGICIVICGMMRGLVTIPCSPDGRGDERMPVMGGMEGAGGVDDEVD